MKHVSVLLKPASSLCNLKCQYCFYANVSSIREVPSYGKMTIECAKEIIQQLYTDLKTGDHLTIAFQGGEPTLVGLSFYEQLIELICQQTKKVHVHYVIQTNGMIINQRWADFFRQHQFLVGLSLDGLPEFHDTHRVDWKQKGTYQRVLKTKKLFEANQVDYNILCVLTSELASRPKEIYQWLQREKIQYVQFIPCLSDFDQERNASSLTPALFYTFYESIFNDWLQELASGVYRSIKLFDDVFNWLLHGQVNACGLTGQCQVQAIIEADGSVYPCDFYATDDYRMGYLPNEPLSQLNRKEVVHKFLTSRRELPQRCECCSFKMLCGGGCKRMTQTMYVNQNGDFCGYQALLKLMVSELKVVNDLVNQRSF